MRSFPSAASLLIAVSAQAYTEGDVPAAKLLLALKNGVMFPETKNAFQHDMEKPKNTSMYGLKNATYWTADFDVDCDGTETANCNKKRDPWYQNQLSIGVNLKADEVPYFVIPIGSPSNSSKRDIQFGQIAALIHNDQVVYAVFVDECGVSSLIGEGSYAAAKLLGIDPDPNTGGSDGPATFLVFTGPTGRITDRSLYTNHQKAIEIGNARAKELMEAYQIDWTGATGARDGLQDRGGTGAALEKAFRIDGLVLSVSTAAPYSVEFLDSVGRKVFSRIGMGSGHYDLRALKAGVYTLRITTPDRVHSAKVPYLP